MLRVTKLREEGESNSCSHVASAYHLEEVGGTVIRHLRELPAQKLQRV
jgi:hypothetical protein